MEFTTDDLKSFFAEQHRVRTTVPTYTIAPQSNPLWTLETTFALSQDAMHTQSNLNFDATHICIMLLPHGGLHAIRVMGDFTGKLLRWMNHVSCSYDVTS